MIDCLIFRVRNEEYKQWFLDYLELELEKCNMWYSIYDIIKIFQVIELDLLERKLFDKFELTFVRYINSELEKMKSK